MDVTAAAPAGPPPAAAAAAPGAPAPPAAVELHVGELVLAGFRPEDRHRIGAALQGELARLLADEGVPPGLAGGVEAATLRASPADLPRDAHPALVGARLARSVYRALGGR